MCEERKNFAQFSHKRECENQNPFKMVFILLYNRLIAVQQASAFSLFASLFNASSSIVVLIANYPFLTVILEILPINERIDMKCVMVAPMSSTIKHCIVHSFPMDSFSQLKPVTTLLQIEIYANRLCENEKYIFSF